MANLMNDDKEQREGVHGLLCGLIQVLSVKVTKAELLPYCDAVMTNFLQVLQTKNTTCHEEAFSALSAIATILEGDFVKYMGAMQPYLISGLRNFAPRGVHLTGPSMCGKTAASKLVRTCR